MATAKTSTLIGSLAIRRPSPATPASLRRRLLLQSCRSSISSCGLIMWKWWASSPSGSDRERIFSHSRANRYGLEEVLAEELSALGAKEIQPKSRLVICSGDLAYFTKRTSGADRDPRSQAAGLFPRSRRKGAVRGREVDRLSRWLSTEKRLPWMAMSVLHSPRIRCTSRS